MKLPNQGVKADLVDEDISLQGPFSLANITHPLVSFKRVREDFRITLG
jgi:hypothetical protein